MGVILRLALALALVAALLAGAPSAEALRSGSRCVDFKSGIFSGTGKICLLAVWNRQGDGVGTRVHYVNFWSPDAHEFDSDPALDFVPLDIRNVYGTRKWVALGSLSRDEVYTGYVRRWGRRHPMRIATPLGYLCVHWKAHVNNAPDDSGAFCLRIS